MKTLVLAVILLWSQTLWAEGPDSPSTAGLFAAPAYEMGVPEAVVRAIATVESGLKPWALNIEGKSFHFNSKREALARAEEAWAAGRSFDVGLMQVNNWWLKKYGIPLEAALDPVANVYFGVWILKEELLRHGDLRTAVGAYHSPMPARASRYADQVMAVLEGKRKVAGPDVVTARRFSAESEKTAAVRPTEVAEPILNAAPNTVMASISGISGIKVAATAPNHSMKIKLKRRDFLRME